MQLNYKVISWVIITALVFYFLYSVSGILLPFIVGVFVAYALNPAVEHLTKWKIPRSLASIILILGFLVIFVGLLGYALPFLKEKFMELYKFPHLYWEKTFDYIKPILSELNQHVKIEDLNNFLQNSSKYMSELLAWVFGFLYRLLTNSMAVVNILSLIILMPLIAFYLLRDWKKILFKIESLLPREQASDIIILAKHINTALGGYVRGQATICLILAIYYSVGLYLVGLKFAFTIGMVTGLLTFIPYIGVVIGIAAGLGIAIAQFDTIMPIAQVVLVFGIGSLLEGYILGPKLIGDKVGLHPVWMIFALLAGAFLFGFIGILLAVPAAAVIGVLVRHFIHVYLNSTLYKSGVKNSVAKRKAQSASSHTTNTES